jgi:hypothetical protein
MTPTASSQPGTLPAEPAPGELHVIFGAGLKRGVRQAAACAGARLVVLDCLYMYGRPERVPFDEDTPLRPCSRKGELRATLARELFEAHARGDVRATTGRASDYFGPDVPVALLGTRFAERLLAGKPLEMGGDPDQPHGRRPPLPRRLRRRADLPRAGRGRDRRVDPRALHPAGGVTGISGSRSICAW